MFSPCRPRDPDPACQPVGRIDVLDLGIGPRLSKVRDYKSSLTCSWEFKRLEQPFFRVRVGVRVSLIMKSGLVVST